MALPTWSTYLFSIGNFKGFPERFVRVTATEQIRQTSVIYRKNNGNYVKFHFMPEVTVLRIFIASPGELPENEREVVHDVCESLNRSAYFKQNKLRLETVGWESHVYPKVCPEHPQAELTEIAANSDILVAIFNRRLGGSGYATKSGTVDEIEAAIKEKERSGVKPEVMVYFREAKDDLPDSELIEVRNYEKDLHKRKCRTESYVNAKKFGIRLYEALMATVEGWLSSKGSGVIPGEKSIKELLAKVPQPLLQWPSTVDGKWLNRPELDQIFERISVSFDESIEAVYPVLLLGAPGTGKSALLSALGKKLIEKETQVLSIKADQVPSTVVTETGLMESLGLPFEPSACLRRLSHDGPVVLIVDQLDAVSEITDRKSERFNVLLNLIQSASVIDGVRVVASSRIFEYQHDVRLSTIEAVTVTLQPPAKEDISEILKTRGINLANLTEEVQGLLSVPLNLKLFMESLGRDEGRLALVQSIQDLYEEIWRQKIEGASSPEKSITLVHEIAEWMGGNEDLWAPSSIADASPASLAELEAQEIIVREGRRIGFRHQTFFDFIVARGFIKDKASLLNYVRDRQDGLFVRPKLLAIMDYLRGTSKKRYHKELTEIWHHTELRAHIAVLLDEKVGSFPDPDVVEAGLILPLFTTGSKARKGRLLRSMAGSPGWFKIGKSAFVPQILSNPEEAWLCRDILIYAWTFAHEDVIEIIERCLLPNPGMDDLVIVVLQSVDRWDEKTVNILCQIARRKDNYDFSSIVSDLSQSLPTAASKVIRADFEKKLEKAIKMDAEIPEPPPLSENPSEEEYAKRLLFDSNKHLKSLFEIGNEWYDLSEIAKAAHSPFLDEIWPWFVKVLSMLAYESNPLVNQYMTDKTLSSFEAEESLPEKQPVASICAAIVDLAKEHPERFLEFFSKNVDSQYLLVHRLLSRGLAQIADKHSALVFEYLTSDASRLAIGDYYRDKLKESRMLISKGFPYLSEEERVKLEEHVLTWKFYPSDRGESPKDKKDTIKWNRMKRLRLLRAFPKDYLSLRTKRILEEEERALPSTEDWDSRFSGVYTVGSRMGQEQMSKATNEQLLGLFEELDDSTEWEHPRYKWGPIGGVIQASREFEILAEKEPRRVIELIKNFKTGKQEIPAGYALSGLSKSDVSAKDFYALIHELDKKGFSSNGFRGQVASALDIIARKEHGLPEDMIKLMEGWLPENPEPSLESATRDDDKQDGSNSVIWGYGGFVVLAGGRATIVNAITMGYLLRKPTDIAGWTEFLRKLLEFERHPKVWQIIAPHLIHLFRGDKAEAVRILDRLFASVPSFRDGVEGAVLIANSLRHVINLDVSRAWLRGIKESEWKLGLQAYGEVLLLWRCLFKDDGWGRDEVEACLQENKIGTCRGLAFSAANLYKNIEFQTICAEVMVRLAGSDDGITQQAIAKVFRYDEDIVLNEPMKRIIRAILSNEALLLTSAERLLEGLEPNVAAEPDLVCDVCAKFLDVRVSKMETLRMSFFRTSEILVNMALTLHRMPAYRAKGLELFERLIENDIYEARQAMSVLDRATIHGRTQTPRMPRRRRRKKG